jgi:mRNA interferase MazF
MEEYFKDFDKWDKIAKSVDQNNKNREIFFREQEIWWCSVGVNIGSEIDGKNDQFERPVLVIRKINNELIFVAPLTTKIVDNKFRINVRCANIDSQILLNQCKTISTRRLLRNIGIVKKKVFQEVIITLIKLIIK